MSRTLTHRCIACAVLLFAPAAGAQLNNPWVTFTRQPAKLGVPLLALSDGDTQVLFRTGYLDQDTWDDVVAVRKQQSSQLGKRTAYLLMNLGGVLTDRTTALATASDVPGDLGFRTPCNNRECALGDVDGDGWLDMITAVTLSDGDPKHLSHPRVYVNLGEDGSGVWQGLKFENGRVPQLKTVAGLAVAPRFCGMALADVTGDGAGDLYFVDYDSTETGIPEQSSWDLNDRLLVNDGNGWFTDGSVAHLTPSQLLSAFGADAEILDLNGDGALDIVKDTTLNSPMGVRLLYNDPADVGNFATMGVQDIGSGSPYGMDVGNLNNDAILDVVIADDGSDKFRLGTGYDALNRIAWGPLKNFTFLNGSDDGFGHSVYIRDLDDDGWNDVLVTDVDGDLLGCDRRLHIYHNTATIPGEMNPVLVEEVELASGSQGAGWKGAVGILAADSKGSYDVGFGDFDKDGDVDLLIGTCTGTRYFQNETDPPSVVCQTDVGFGGPGSMAFSLCGDDLTEVAGMATMQLIGAAPTAPIFLPLSLSAGPVPLKGGTLLPFPVLVIVTGLMTDGAGEFTMPVSASPGAPLHVYMQCVVKNGAVYELSNALDCVFGF